MPTKVTTGGLRLPTTAFQSQAPGYAEVARSLAGRITELFELVTGLPSSAGEQPVTTTNPQGRTGWDLSGPPWGNALMHPVAWFSGAANDANLAQPTDIYDLEFRAAKPAFIEMHFWNRMHSKLPAGFVAPYDRLYWVLRGARIAGAVTPTGTVRTWNPRLGQRRETAQTTTFTCPTATDTQLFNAAVYVSAVSGWNTVCLEVSITDTTTAFELTAGSLNQIVKQSHT